MVEGKGEEEECGVSVCVLAKGRLNELYFITILTLAFNTTLFKNR